MNTACCRIRIMKIRVFVWESSSYKLKEQTCDGTKELQLGSQLFNSRVSSLESVWTKAGGSSDRVITGRAGFQLPAVFQLRV